MAKLINRPAVNSFERKYHALKEYSAKAMESLAIPPDSVRLKQWPKLDDLIGGLRPYEYSLLCGGTGTGKSALAASLVESVASSGIGCLVASVENGPVDFSRRLMSARVGENWNEGDAIPISRLSRFEIDHPTFFDLPVQITTYEDRVNNTEMMNQVRKAVAEDNVKLVILDNLNFFLEVTSQNQSVIELDRVTHDWIILCKQLPAHIVMITHPRKTENGRVESEFDIKGSSTSVQEAHNVFLFNRISDKVKADQPLVEWDNYRELKIAKCRRKGRGAGKKVLFHSRDGGRYVEQNPESDGAYKANPFSFRQRAHLANKSTV